MSKEELVDLLRFVEHQISFTLESTKDVGHYNDFLTSMEAVVLFNSTCMCLQTIGESILSAFPKPRHTRVFRPGPVPASVRAILARPLLTV